MKPHIDQLVTSHPLRKCETLTIDPSGLDVVRYFPFVCNRIG